MKRLLTTTGLVLGLSCVSMATLQAQGLPEENMAIYKNLSPILTYSSGVGAWANQLSINEDGSFQGYFWDDDMGVAGEGYPNGTRYECTYEGQFEVPSKVSDTVYETMLMYVETEQEPDQEEILDGVRYIYSPAYGISNGNVFTLYLPGTPREELPEAVFMTPRWAYDAELAEVPAGECILYNQDAEICFIGTPGDSDETETVHHYEVLEDLPAAFVFASGAGAWGNELQILADGTFVGTYHDSEMGATGPGYNGSVYLSEYSGAFSEPVQVDETVYEMELLYYDTSTETDTEKIIDEVKYIYTEPYGLEYAGVMTLYLPGTPYSIMPEAARHSAMWLGGAEDDYLGKYRYVLYNEEEDLCFFGTKEYDNPQEEQEQVAAPAQEESCDYILPNVSVQYYTQEQIDQLTLQEVNYAKNEIYAIHGRIFKSTELQEYFNSTDWYRGTIDGNSFNTSVFNDYENANLQLLVNRETKLAGQDGYALNQPGYDIHSVRKGYLDGFSQGEGKQKKKSQAVA